MFTARTHSEQLGSPGHQMDVRSFSVQPSKLRRLADVTALLCYNAHRKFPAAHGWVIVVHQRPIGFHTDLATVPYINVLPPVTKIAQEICLFILTKMEEKLVAAVQSFQLFHLEDHRNKLPWSL